MPHNSPYGESHAHQNFASDGSVPAWPGISHLDSERAFEARAVKRYYARERIAFAVSQLPIAASDAFNYRTGGSDSRGNNRSRARAVARAAGKQFDASAIADSRLFVKLQLGRLARRAFRFDGAADSRRRSQARTTARHFSGIAFGRARA